ncbi:MAG: hypothetical protein ACOYYU_04190 [Chloroflexota bacterium]
MTTSIDIGQALGVLGAYFAVLLVLAVAIETIIEPITSIPWFKGLVKKVSPDDFMKDVKEWLPANSAAAAQAASIAAFMEEYDTKVDDLSGRLEKLKTIGKDTAKALGAGEAVDEASQKVALYMTEIRKKYDIDERKRITALRFISALIGIGLALWLQIDSFSLLTGLLPEGFAVEPWLGMVITGLAASAGSSFWHDMLGRVRAVKEASQQVQETVKK